MRHVPQLASGPDWLGLVAAVLALASCYGTLAIVAVLSAPGTAPGLEGGIWAATIALFTVVAVAAVALGRRRHARVGPALLAAAGSGLILWALFGTYILAVEVAGFASLIAAAAWDRRLRRAGHGSEGCKKKI